MSKIFKILFDALVFLSSAMVYGQQLPQYSLYMLNPFSINPAYAGVENQVEIRSQNKYQWTGISDAPRTYNLSFTNTAMGTTLGYGGHVFTDVTGPNRRIGVNGAFAYHFNVTETLRGSIGVSMGVTQFALDGDKINVREGDDPIVSSRLSSDYLFDVKTGIHLYHEKYFFGISIPNLLQNEVNVFELGMPIGQLEPHYNVMGGYFFDLNDDFTLSPSALLKYVEPAPFKIDLNLIAKYQDRFWLGGGYRLNDGIIALAGCELNNRIQISYAYDIINSNLQSYSGGVHEVLIGLNFTKPTPKSKEELPTED